MLSVCPPPPNQLLNAWTNLYEIGKYIMAPEPNSTEYFINTSSHQSVFLYVYFPIVARQRLGDNVTVVTNTHATIDELLDASFSMRYLVSY
jgi:hypothetical protein